MNLKDAIDKIINAVESGRLSISGDNKEAYNKISIRHEKNERGIYPIRVTPIVDLMDQNDVSLFMRIDGIGIYYTKKYRDEFHDDKYVLLIKNKDAIKFANKFDGFIRLKPRDNYLLKNNAFWFIKMLLERSNECEIYIGNVDDNIRSYFANVSSNVVVV